MTKEKVAQISFGDDTMKVTFYFPFALKFSNKNVREIKYLGDEYGKFKRNSIEFLKLKEFRDISKDISKILDPAFVSFHVFQGKIDDTDVEILIFESYPLVLFTFYFEISEISDLAKKVGKLKREANSYFNQLLNSLFKSERASRDSWKQHKLLEWKKWLEDYYIFEGTEEEVEALIDGKIACAITGQSLQENYLSSHMYYTESLKIFCGKSFSAILYKTAGSSPENYTQKTKNCIRDIFLFGEIMLRTLQNVAINSIGQLTAASKEELSTWTEYFAGFTEPIRIVMSNAELTRESMEITFGMCSKLDALDRTLDNAKLVASLRSTLANESLQKSVDTYTRILTYLTIVVVVLTVATVLSNGDSLFRVLEDIIRWIQKYLYFYPYLYFNFS